MFPGARPSAAQTTAPSTYNAYTGTDVKVVPPPPALGPANSVMTDPAFGSRILRVTDANTNGGESFISTDSGFSRTWNADSTAIKLTGPYGAYWLEFNPNTFQVGTRSGEPVVHPLSFGTTWEWSAVQPNILYYLSGSTIESYNTTSGASTPLASTPTGDPVTYMAAVIGLDNWVCAAAGAGLQNTYTKIFCVSPSNPSTWKFIDVVNETINGAAQSSPNWPTSAAAETIGIHDISGGTGPNWLEVTFHQQSWGANGGAVFNLSTNTWSLVTNADIYWSGHVSMGNGKYENGAGSINGEDSRGVVLRDPDNLMNSSEYVFAMQPFAPWNGWCDVEHSSWLNSLTNPNAPILDSRYSLTASCQYAWSDEIIAAAVDGSNTVWRFAHNFNGGSGCYFDEAFAQISNDGNWALFSSYWGGTLGPDTSFGCTTRIDTFIVDLKDATGPPPAPASQSITFAPLRDVAVGAAPVSIVATASSGLPVSFSSTTAAVCSISGTSATIVGAGTCSITASQSGDTAYSAAAPVTQTFTVLALQTISFGPLMDRTLGSSPPPLSATATSGLGVTFASNSTPVCTVSGVNITLVAVGVCSITASQPGNSTYAAAAAVTQTFSVSAAGIQPVAAFLDRNGAPALSFNGSTIFPDAGGFLTGAPGVAQGLSGNTYVVGLDDAGGVHLNSYSFANSAWNGWQYSGGILDTSSGLTAAVDPNGMVWFTGRDIGNRYWINSWNGAGFGGWIPVPDGIFAGNSVPQIAITGDGTVWIIGTDIGGRIWSNSYSPTNQTFTGWVDRHGVIYGQPSATAGQDGFVYVAVRNVASESPVYITQIPAGNAATATTFVNGGGQTDTDPQITSQGGTVYALAKADGNTVYLLTFSEATQTFLNWSFTGGILNSATIAAAGGNVFIAGLDSAGRIYWYNVNGKSWFLAGGAGISSTVLSGGK
jgi:hypothetical protein